MTENSSLDDFVSVDPDSDDKGVESAPASDGVGTVPDADTDTDLETTPARTTYAWSPAGLTCEDCGSVADRRWRDGDALVCADCKTW